MITSNGGARNQENSDSPHREVLMRTKAPSWLASSMIAVVVLALLFMLGSDTAHATTFNLTGSLCLDDQNTVDPDPLKPGNAGECDGSDAAGAKVALTSSFGVGLGPDGQPKTADDTPDSNFGVIVAFTPGAWGVAKDADIPDGALVGELRSRAVLGLLGNPCSNEVNVSFDLQDGTVDTTNTIAPNPPGTPNRLDPLADKDGDGIFDGAEKYPQYLNELFSDLTPRARYIGANTKDVPGTTVIINFMVFEPGTTFPTDPPTTTDPADGYPSVTVLQDPSAPVSGADPVNDFCSPLLSATTLFGTTKDNPKTGANEGGKPFRTNPPAGTYQFVTVTRSLPDADDDGIENGLDPCQLVPNPAWNPRAVDAVNDPDGDGLPGADADKDGVTDPGTGCDPKPTTPRKSVV